MYHLNFKEMKNKILNSGKIVIVGFLMAAEFTNAQPPVHQLDHRHVIERPRPDILKEITTVSGTVSKMAVNEDFVYDGFYLATKGESILIKFPPHLGNQITTLAKQGNNVSVKGVADVAPNGEKLFRLNSITANGKTIEDLPTTILPTPSQEISVSDSGTITNLQRNKEGDAVVGLFVGNTILKMPPHIYQQLGSSLVNGTKISFTGFKKVENAGEVAEKKYNIVHARTISVNGKDYSL